MNLGLLDACPRLVDSIIAARVGIKQIRDQIRLIRYPGSLPGPTSHPALLFCELLHEGNPTMSKVLINDSIWRRSIYEMKSQLAIVLESLLWSRIALPDISQAVGRLSAGDIRWRGCLEPLFAKVPFQDKTATPPPSPASLWLAHNSLVVSRIVRISTKELDQYDEINYKATAITLPVLAALLSDASFKIKGAKDG